MKLAEQLRVALGTAAAMRSQHWPAARIAQWQERRLVQMMRHAVTHVPHYRDLGIRADELRGAQDLQRFPLLTKAEIQRAGARLLAVGVQTSERHSSRTSGSTGEPTTTYFDRDAWLKSRYALKLRRLLATSGLAPGQRVLIVSEAREADLAAVSSAAPAGGRLFARRYVSIHAPIAAHIEAIVTFRPTALYAFPSYLAELVDAIALHGSALPPIPLIYTSSEVLTPGVRAHIERALRGRICDVYGSTEFKEIAWQCAAHRYHLNFESVWLEPLPADRAAPLVFSTLLNRAMPLLRFRIGDEARAATGVCACGRQSPGLASIEGRQADVITLPGGRSLSPYLLTTIIERDPAIVQYRIVETAPAIFRIEIVGGTVAAHADAQLVAQLRAVAGDCTSFSIQRLASLARARSGKRSVFVRQEGEL